MSCHPEMRRGSLCRGSLSRISNGAAFLNKPLLTTTALALVLSANIAQAQTITATGDVLPSTSPTLPTWTITNLTVGNTGTGTVTIANAAAINATTSTIIANLADSTGTLNFGAPAGSAPAPTGTLTTPTVTLGAGNGTINFNQTDTLIFSAPISGPGVVNQIGSGTTILTATSPAPNNYTGATTASKAPPACAINGETRTA